VSAPALPSLLVSHWSLSPTVLVPVLASGALYAFGTRRVAGHWAARRTLSFLAGLGCVLLALQSGIDAYDDQLLSIHMVQHMLLLVAAPPLLLAGRPLVLALRALPPRRRARLARALDRTRGLTAPLPALAVFAAVILLTHLPSFYDATVRHAALHDIEHVLYIGAGLVMWSPLLDGDPVPRHRLSGLGKLGYLIVAMMPMALVGAYLNRHAALFYPAYGPPARALGVSALDDQAQAGAIMWVAGGVVMTAVGLWSAVAAMVAEERRLQTREAREAREARAVPLAAPGPGGRP
jgi:putative membrane protein